MSKLRSVNTHFWTDNFVIELDPIDKLLFLYLLTNSQTNMLGIYELHVRKISFDTGIDIERVRKGFESFAKGNKASYLDGYVCLHNFTKHQSYNTNMKKSALNSFDELPLSVQKQPFCKPIIKGLKPLPKGSEPFAKIESELEAETEKEIEVESKTFDMRAMGCPIPDQLQIDGFVNRYEEYWDYMQETHRHNHSIGAVQSHFRRLMELQEKGNDPLRVIDQTMAAGNKSFYPLKDNQFNGTENKQRSSSTAAKTKTTYEDDILKNREN